MLLGKKIISNSKLIAESFNNIFLEIEPKHVNEIETPGKYSQTAYLLCMNELIKAIFSLQIKKSRS